MPDGIFTRKIGVTVSFADLKCADKVRPEWATLVALIDITPVLQLSPLTGRESNMQRELTSSKYQEDVCETRPKDGTAVRHPKRDISAELGILVKK